MVHAPLSRLCLLGLVLGAAPAGASEYRVLVPGPFEHGGTLSCTDPGEARFALELFRDILVSEGADPEAVAAEGPHPVEPLLAMALYLNAEALGSCRAGAMTQTVLGRPPAVIAVDGWRAGDAPFLMVYSIETAPGRAPRCAFVMTYNGEVVARDGAPPTGPAAPGDAPPAGPAPIALPDCPSPDTV